MSKQLWSDERIKEHVKDFNGSHLNSRTLAMSAMFGMRDQYEDRIADILRKSAACEQSDDEYIADLRQRIMDRDTSIKNLQTTIEQMQEDLSRMAEAMNAEYEDSPSGDED